MNKDTYNGYEHLASAIIGEAVKDYLHIRKRLYRINGNTADARSLRKELKKIKQFFRSEWFTVLSDIDGVKLEQQLDEMYDSWKLKQAK